jgi:coenzyme F420-reducing hydrogenase beta subunit
MKPDNEGFLYPEIIKKNCARCNLCKDTCPAIPRARQKNNVPPVSFAAINNDEEARKNSSSGGIAGLLTEEILKQNGVVFGAKFDKNFMVVHESADDLEGVAHFRGSKYVQSSINECFRECKKYLENGRMVLFSGTPCQISGLKAYLQREYANLLCVDIICHGTPSPRVWKKYLEYREFTDKQKPREIYFRKKTPGWVNFSLLFSYTNGSQYTGSVKEDSFYKCFLQNICLRLSCYRCAYITIDRRSDITVADFWGIDHICPQMFDDRGTSLVLIHSKKGEIVFNSIKNMCTSKPVDTDTAVKSNRNNIYKIHRNRKKFFMDLDTLPWERLVEKHVNRSIP